MSRYDQNSGVAHATPPVLQMRNITKKFGSLIANDSLSLTLNKSEILGLLGENGAGKSTLMKILYGLYSQDSGEILVNGKKVDIDSPKQAASYGIGMVHQEFMLVPPLTVTENIILGLEPGNSLSLNMRKAEKDVISLSNNYGLNVDPDAKIMNLSVGRRQRVEILKALYRNVNILILDEPTAVLTPQEVDELFDILRDFVKKGFSIIFITHKLGEVMDLCHRVTVLRDGKMVDTVKVADTSREQLAKMMVGREVLFKAKRIKRESGDLVLQVNDVDYSEDSKRTAIKGLSLNVNAGEVLGIAGVDGNGQKELSEIISGMVFPDNGEILMSGENITYLNPKERYQLGMAFIPEDRKRTGLVMDFTISENLALRSYDYPPIAKNGWFRPKEMNNNAEKLIQEFDVRPRQPEILAKKLSGGNQQKVILARELDGQPRLILAAQPTRGLDVGAIELVHRMLMDERKRGAAIILISFELDEIRSLSDRITVMYEGQLVGEVSNEEATDELLGLWMAGVTDESQELLGDSVHVFM